MYVFILLINNVFLGIDHIDTAKTVLAYLGPGGAVSTLGALLALIVAIIVSVLGFMWYPFRRLIRKLRNKDQRVEDDVKE